MSHVVLIGDSIFDNGVYVTPEPDVSRQLRARLGSGWTVTLLATDGHVTNDVAARQLARVPGDASHLVVSVGGNDALGHSSLLSAGASSVADALGRLAAAQASFARDYSRMIEATLQLGIPAAVCTIYDANHPPPLHGLIVSALALFNDVITRAAFAHGVPLIDLRLICKEPADYANPIEPSATGGDKIALAIADVVRTPRAPRSMVWAGA